MITLPPITSIAEELRHFWEIEEPPPPSLPLTADEQECEDHFVRTHERASKGRYVLRSPFKEKPGTNDNRGTSVSRMQQVERRLAKNPALRSQYNRFMYE